MKTNSLLKRISVLALALTLVVALCACAKGAANDMAYSQTTGASATGGAAPGMSFRDDGKFEAAEMETADVTMDVVMEESAALETGAASSGQNDSEISEKIIYSANAYVETTDFDAAIEEVYFMVDSYGGFIEGSYVSGASYSTVYYDRQTYRNAWFTIRIPASSFADVSGSLDRFGYVTGIETYSDNITAQFYDTQTRRDAYVAEHARLVELLDKAENVDELIYIESRLSEVQYNIDSLNSTLKNWQNEVDYSTIHLYIDEVAVIRVAPQVTESYWQQIGTGLRDTLTGIGEFFKDLFMNIVISLPVLLIWAVIIVVIVLVIKKLNRKRKAAGKLGGRFNKSADNDDSK